MLTILRIGALALLIGAGLIAPSKATPFAGVQNAFWSARFAYYQENNVIHGLPDGITITCFGDAGGILVGVGPGCGNTAHLIVNDGSQTISEVGGLSITNTTDIDYLGFFVFKTDFSAFNPGGPSVGAKVDDPLTEYAAYSSFVSGLGVGDSHGCNTLTGPNFMSPTSCGVFSPDSSQGEFGLGPLKAGQTISTTYTIGIHAEVIRTPEPGTLALFGAGILGAIRIRRRQTA